MKQMEGLPPSTIDEDARKYRELLPLLDELVALREKNLSKLEYSRVKEDHYNVVETEDTVLCGKILGHWQAVTDEEMDFICEAANITTRIKEVLEG